MNLGNFWSNLIWTTFSIGTNILLAEDYVRYRLTLVHGVSYL